MSNGNAEYELGGIRKDYLAKTLALEDTSESPFVQFRKWLNEALESRSTEPTAMVLSTADASGRPSSRIVLLKDVAKERFVFFTNYLSQKGQELAVNPFASLLFFWPELERQVRIEGTVVKTSLETSASYFQSRPRESRISAFISPQSREIPNRGFLEKNFFEIEKKFKDKEIPLPESWGGYELIPDRVEFWQGRSNRLHDRILYLRKPEQTVWERVRLAP